MKTEILEGVIVKGIHHPLTINGTGKYWRTQKYVLIQEKDITKFKLKIGDKVTYGGEPYQAVNIYEVKK